MRGEQTTENKAKFDRDSPARGARFDGKRMLSEPLTAPLKGIISPRFSRKSKFSRSHRRTRSDPLCFKTLSGALSGWSPPTRRRWPWRLLLAGIAE